MTGTQVSNSLVDVPHYQAGRGPIPLFDVSFDEELVGTWGRAWGAQSHTGRLQTVMVHRPGPENVAEQFNEDLDFFNLPAGLPDLDQLRREHDGFCDVMRREGCEVIYLEPEEPLVGTYGFPARATVFGRTGTVVNGGTILDRQSSHYKRGIERFYARRLAEIGCPILYTVHGRGVWESSDLIFVDPTCVVIARTIRSNQEGIDQILPVLRRAGVEEVIYTDLPGYLSGRGGQWGGSSGFFHLDNVFGMAAENLAVVYVGAIGYHCIDQLIRRGVEIIEVPDEEVNNLPANLLVLRPGVVVMPSGSPRTAAALESRGLTVHRVDFGEFLKSGGGPKCITMPLIVH